LTRNYNKNTIYDYMVFKYKIYFEYFLHEQM
jgi:hypothetical protein